MYHLPIWVTTAILNCIKFNSTHYYVLLGKNIYVSSAIVVFKKQSILWRVVNCAPNIMSWNFEYGWRMTKLEDDLLLRKIEYILCFIYRIIHTELKKHTPAHYTSCPYFYMNFYIKHNFCYNIMINTFHAKLCVYS